MTSTRTSVAWIAGLVCASACAPEEITVGSKVDGSGPSRWRLAHYVKPRAHQPEAGFGRVLAQSTGRVFVAAPFSSECGDPEQPDLRCDRRGAVFGYDAAPNDDTLRVLQRENAPQGDTFGLALSSDERWLAGSISEGRGGVAVYDLEDLSTPPELLVSPNPVRYFGRALAVASPWIAVLEPGACSELAISCPETGEVHLFHRGASGWSHAQTLPVPLRRRNHLSQVLALADGVLAVGSPGYFADCEEAVGRVHLFSHDGNAWSPAGEVEATEACSGLGTSVALHGGRLYAGAPLSGEVIVYDVTTRQEVDRFRQVEGDVSRFGFSLDVDERHLAVGAPRERSCTIRDDPGPLELENVDTSCNGNIGHGPGAVLVYELRDRGAAPLLFKGVIAHAQAGFGYAVALGPEHLFVGAPGDASLGTGVGVLRRPRGAKIPTWAEGSGAFYAYERPIR